MDYALNLSVLRIVTDAICLNLDSYKKNTRILIRFVTLNQNDRRNIIYTNFKLQIVRNFTRLRNRLFGTQRHN